MRVVLVLSSLLLLTGCKPGSSDLRQASGSASAATGNTTTVAHPEKRKADCAPLPVSPSADPVPEAATEQFRSLDPSIMRYLRCTDIDCADGLRAVVAAGPSLIPQLLQLLHNGPAPEIVAELPGNATRAVTLKVVAALGAMNDPRALDPLAGALKNPDPLLRAEVIRALGGFSGNSKALAALLPLLGDPDPLVREETVASLQKTGCGEAVAALRKALAVEPADYIRDAMVKAIRMLEAR